MEAAREEAGFELMETHIRRRQNKFAQYIATRKIMDLCKMTERKGGWRVGMRWGEQAGLDLEGGKETAAMDEEGMEE